MARYIETNCPICELDTQNVEVSDFDERFSVVCRRCGKFKITDTAAKKAKKEGISYKLSAWIKDLNDIGTEIPDIDEKALENIVMSLPCYRVSEKQLILMRAIERKTEFPGYAFRVELNLDYPLAWAKGKDEFGYLLKSLADRGLLGLQRFQHQRVT